MMERNPDSHKGENGKVLVVGGSEKYVGAPYLAAKAALRIGTDLSMIAAPEKAAYAMNSLSPDVITIKLQGKELQETHVEKIQKELDDSDCLLIGPGLGKAEGTVKAVEKICRNTDKPKVVDADALNASNDLDNAVVTPHSKEFERTFGKKPSRKTVKEEASKKKKVILLKGPTDIVSNGEKVFENEKGNAGMTVGGTGDVLAGIIAGLVSQGKPLFESACLAAEINSEAGDLLAREIGYGFVASDLLPNIPKAYNKVTSRETDKRHYFR